MSTSLLWTSLARAALSTLPQFLLGISMSGIAKQRSEIMCCCCCWQEQSSWLACSCLVSICLACMQCSNRIGQLCIRCHPRKDVGMLWEKCSLWNTLGKVFHITVELDRFDTKSINSVLMGILFPKCSHGNPFFMQKWTSLCFFSCNYNDPM
jgi:hypothetical protein